MLGCGIGTGAPVTRVRSFTSSARKRKPIAEAPSKAQETVMAC